MLKKSAWIHKIILLDKVLGSYEISKASKLYTERIQGRMMGSCDDFVGMVSNFECYKVYLMEKYKEVTF